MIFLLTVIKIGFRVIKAKILGAAIKGAFGLISIV
jgi:hypothetical protein